MPLWNKSNTPPKFHITPTANLSSAGWVNPTTGEVLVNIGDTSAISGLGDITGIALPQASTGWSSNDFNKVRTLLFNVTFKNKVKVTGTPKFQFTLGGGPTLTASYTRNRGKYTLQFAAPLTLAALVGLVNITNGGTGFTSAPTIGFTGGGGTGAAATATFANGLNTISVTAGSSYTSAPTVSFTGGAGTGAAATATVSGGAITAFVITNRGTGYTSAPTVVLTGGGGTGGGGTATITGYVNSITMTNTGSGYTSVPTVTFTGGAGTGAAATAVIGQGGVVAAVSPLLLNSGTIKNATTAANMTLTFTPPDTHLDIAL